MNDMRCVRKKSGRMPAKKRKASGHRSAVDSVIASLTAGRRSLLQRRPPRRAAKCGWTCRPRRRQTWPGLLGSRPRCSRCRCVPQAPADAHLQQTRQVNDVEEAGMSSRLACQSCSELLQDAANVQQAQKAASRGSRACLATRANQATRDDEVSPISYIHLALPLHQHKRCTLRI